MRGPKPKKKSVTLRPVARERCNPPPHLDAIAVAEFRRIVAAGGDPQEEELSLLAAYCQAYSRWVAAEEDIARHGLTIRTKTSVVANPAVAVATKAMELMLRVGVEFGLTPVSRNRVAAKTPAAEKHWFDAALESRRMG